MGGARWDHAPHPHQRVLRSIAVSGPASRQALLDAARRLQRDDPARALGARQIAREAGVNHSLVFRHFGSVAELLDALGPTQFDALGDAIDTSPSLSEALVALVAGVLEHRTLLATQIARSLSQGTPAPVFEQLRPPLARLLVRTRRCESEEASERAELAISFVVGAGVLISAEVTPDHEVLVAATEQLLGSGADRS